MEGKRIRNFGTVSGVMKTGPEDKIADVPGVLIGYKTVKGGDNKTGVMVIVPGSGDVFERKFIAAGCVRNRFSKTCGLVQMEEPGTLETLIALVSTLNVGLVADTLVEYIIKQCEKDQVEVTSVSPVVGECNDYRTDRIQHRTVSTEDVMEAFPGADEGFEEGDVDAGAGTACYDLKGGIGSAPKVMRIGGVNCTLGILMQFNFGATEDLAIDGIRVGQRILEEKEGRRKMATAEQDQGSVVTIIAADLPVSDRQLRRTICRAGVGTARTGAYTEYDSGKVMIGFTTADRLQGKDSPEIMTSTYIREDLINVVFKAAAGAVDEVILNSTTATGRAEGLAREVCYSPPESLPQVLRH